MVACVAIPINTCKLTLLLKIWDKIVFANKVLKTKCTDLSSLQNLMVIDADSSYGVGFKIKIDKKISYMNPIGVM